MRIHAVKTSGDAASEDLALFHDLLESSTNPILILNSSLAVLHVNAAADRLFHPGGRQEGPRNLLEFCGPECRYLCELVSSALNGGVPLRNKDVTVGPEAFSLSVHAGQNSWIVTLRPVTRELSLEYLAKRFRQHRDILLEAMDGIEGSVVIVDINRNIRYMNRFTRKYVGDLMHGVEMAKWPKAAGFYREDGVTLLEGPHRIFPRALKGITVIDEAMVIKNEITGEAVRVQASAAPVHDEKGRVVSAIGWFHYVGPLATPPVAIDVDVTEIDAEEE